ncbi:MAG: hypothetical protein ACLGIC_05830 [Acidimicrobiia bacterium]
MELRAFRRTFAVAAVWAAAVGGLLVAPPAASGQEAVSPGRGNAYAQGIKVDPRTGRLSFGVTYGQALAGHQNTIAIAEAHSADLGLLGDQLAGEGCDGGDPTYPEEDQPQPLESRSNGEGAGDEQVETENGVEKRVLATAEPYARAVSTTAAAGDPAAIALGKTSSVTESGLVDGKRLARAVTTVDRVALGGGQVVLRGLRWEAVYQTAPAEEARGTFTIDGIEVAGQRLPIPEENPLGPLAEANAALQPLGFRIDPPEVRTESGIQFVGPLRIGVVPGEVRETIVGPAFNAVQPVRESLFDAIIEADCSNASYITVLDIVLGSVSGAGSLSLELGGVTATSDDIELTSFLGGLPSVPSLSPLPQGSTGRPSVGTTGSAAAPARSSVAASPGAGAAPVADAPAAQPTTDEQAIADVEPLSGSRGGALAGVGLGGLALLAVLAAADRAKMRKAQRSVLMETF